MRVVGRLLTGEQLAHILADPAAANELSWNEGDNDGPAEECLDLDKAWHGVHFLLSGTVDATSAPLGQAVLGGREVGEDDGYGPPRLLDVAAVAEVATALAGLGDEAVRARFDARAMDALDVYPQIWNEDNILEEYLMPSVAALRRFYAQASSRGAAVLLAVQ